MAAGRTGYRLGLATAGALTLALSVFLPWYTARAAFGGAAVAQETPAQIASHFHDPALRSQMFALQAQVHRMAGVQLLTLSGHRALEYVSVVLLVLAALALLDALVPLARGGEQPPDGAGASLAVLGAVACALVLYRIVSPPVLAEGAMALTPRAGAWLALGGSAAIALAGLWPRWEPGEHRAALEGRAERALIALSGWTPEGRREPHTRSAHLGPRRGPRER